jgi:hypothetical protein
MMLDDNLKDVNGKAPAIAVSVTSNLISSIDDSDGNLAYVDLEEIESFLIANGFDLNDPIYLNYVKSKHGDFSTKILMSLGSVLRFKHVIHALYK